MKKIIPAVILISSLLFLGFGCDPNRVTGPQTTGSKNADGNFVASPSFYAVTLNPEGVYPKTLEVISGDTVEFRNSDLKNHLLASNVPELTPTDALPPGGVKQMTMVPRGEWKFVDKNNPNDTKFQITITVK